MKKIVAILGVVLFPVVLSACGNDNESACKDYVQKVQDCGGVWADTYDDAWCDGLNDSDCDISGYFDCLSDALGECDSGDFTNVDMDALGACVSEATCQ